MDEKIRQELRAADRLAALAMYLLLPAALPAVWFSSPLPLASRHRRYALASAALLALLGACFLVSVAVLSYVMITHRVQFEEWRIESYTLDVLWKCLLAWSVVHVFAFAHALLRPNHAAPVLGALGAFTLVRAAGRAAIVAVMLAGLIGTALTMDALRLTQTSPEDARVFFVYEDNDQFPPWIFQLGAHQIARAAQEVYGQACTAVLPINRDNLRRAFQQGEFVVVGSHGVSRGLIVDDAYFRPGMIMRREVNNNLRFVYLTGCDSADLARAWRRKLRPAQVVTHDRLTAVVEHIWWMWVDGPAKLRAVHAQHAQTG